MISRPCRVSAGALVQAHLLRELPRRALGAYNGKGDHGVEIVRYSPEDEAAQLRLDFEAEMTRLQAA
jgi:hypothetical protein